MGRLDIWDEPGEWGGVTMARWEEISSQGAPEAYMCSPKPEVTIEVQHVIMIDYDFARFSIHEKGHGQ